MTLGDWAGIIVTIGVFLSGACGSLLWLIHRGIVRIETSLAEQPKLVAAVDDHGRRISVIETHVSVVTERVQGIDRRIGSIEEHGCPSKNECESG